MSHKSETRHLRRKFFSSVQFFPDFTLISMMALLFVVLGISRTFAQYTPDQSNRVTINMGETPWKFTKGDISGAEAVDFDDSGWKTIGIPHTWNDTDTYINEQSGGGDGSMYGGLCWYRKTFTVDEEYSSRKVFLEFQGAHIGAQVYINGNFIPGNSGINNECTHVNGFLPFVVDITDSITFGQENVVAVCVSNNGYIYDETGFSTIFRFGQKMGGLVRPVFMHITDKTYIPLNVYSVIEKWGTYVKTVVASDASATIAVNTNVYNENSSTQDVTLSTEIVDADGNIVATNDGTESIPAGSNKVFEQMIDVSNPTLWYPAASLFGEPYMYKVYHIVKVGGETVDVFESPLGIRVITWDADYPYINGEQHYMWGASGRYDYPALGSAVPEEQRWRDAKLTAECGGRLWRPGHATCSPQFVDACDHYGVMLVQPSGDGEGTYSSVTAEEEILKTEYHRDMIIRDRNHPSILSWEASNADIDPGFAQDLKSLSVTWDPIHTAAQSERGAEDASGDIHGCTLTGCEIGVKNAVPNEPAWGSEAWGRHSSRHAYDWEIEFAGEFVQNWRKSIENDCFGIAHWYLVETPGEVGDHLEEAEVGERARSFGSSMMDHNREPKLLYHIYDICWTPYEIEPNVALAHHWNRSGNVRVNAFSNCPSVRLVLNGTSLGEKTPNPWNGTGTGNDQNTTELPFQVWWDNVTWEAGTLIAQGLDDGGNVVCADTSITAGSPHHLVLTKEAPLVKPNGEQFNITANGTDCAFIKATVVDESGNWCPETDGINVTFSVSGPGDYRGGSDYYVTSGQDKTFHAPLDPELHADGGMCKVAVKSTFTSGDVTVSAEATGITGDQLTYTVLPVDSGTTSVREGYSGRENPALVMKPQMKVVGNTLSYFINVPSSVSLKIFNAGGRVLKQLTFDKQPEGWHNVQLNSTSGNGINLSNGIYFAHLAVQETKHCVKRMVVVQ